MLNLPSSAINIGSPVNQNHPLNFERIAWWKVLKPWTGGNTFYDLVSNTSSIANGTLSGGSGDGLPVFSSNSHVGGEGSIQFTKAGQLVSVPGIPIFNRFVGSNTTSATFAAWVNPTAFVGSGTILLTRPAGIGLFASTNNDAFVTTSWNNTSAEFGAATNLALTLNQWQFVAGVVNGTSETTYLINPQGSLSSFNQTITAASKSLNAAWTIGDDPQFLTRTSLGSLDDISIWGRALSENEILQLWELSQRGYPGVLNRNKPFLFVPGSVTIVSGSAALSSQSTLSSTAICVINSSANLSDSSVLIADGSVLFSGKAPLVCNSSMLAAPNLIHGGSASLGTTSALTAKPGIIFSGSASFVCNSSMLATSTLNDSSSVSLIATSALMATPGIIFSGSASLVCDSVLTSSLGLINGGSASLGATSFLTTTPNLTHSGSEIIACNSLMMATPNLIRGGSASLVCSSSMVANGLVPPIVVIQPIATIFQDAIVTSESQSFNLTVQFTTSGGTIITNITGKVVFFNNGKPFAGVNIEGGVATLTVTGLEFGRYSISASYLGSVFYDPAQTYGINHIVNGTLITSRYLYVNPTCSASVLIDGTSVCVGESLNSIDTDTPGATSGDES
jgi:Concanavalin A-like lectin/glucanases superfamily/Bacterial Ig-like domain (group 3)